jgi:hypothetical protein
MASAVLNTYCVSADRVCVHRLVDALRFALTACRAEAIDVRLVHYKGVKGDFSKLEAEFATKRRGRGKKNE